MKRDWVQFLDHIVKTKWNPNATGEITKPTKGHTRFGSVPVIHLAGRGLNNVKLNENGEWEELAQRRSRSLSPVQFGKPKRVRFQTTEMRPKKSYADGHKLEPGHCQEHLLDHMRCKCAACMDFACQWRRAVKEKFISQVSGKSKPARKIRRWTHNIGGKSNNYPRVVRARKRCPDDDTDCQRKKWPYVGSPKINWWFGAGNYEPCESNCDYYSTCATNCATRLGIGPDFNCYSDDDDYDTYLDYEWKCDPIRLLRNKGGHSKSSSDRRREESRMKNKKRSYLVNDLDFTNTSDEIISTVSKTCDEIPNSGNVTRKQSQLGGYSVPTFRSDTDRDTDENESAKKNKRKESKSPKRQSKTGAQSDSEMTFDKVAMSGTMSSGALEDHFRSVTCTNPASKMLSPGGFMDCTSGGINASEDGGGADSYSEERKSRSGKSHTERIQTLQQPINGEDDVVGVAELVENQKTVCDKDRSDNRGEKKEKSHTERKSKRGESKSPKKASPEGNYLSSELRKNIEDILKRDHNESRGQSSSHQKKEKSKKGSIKGHKKGKKSNDFEESSQTPRKRSNEDISDTTKFIQKYGVGNEYKFVEGKVVSGSAYLKKDDRGFYHISQPHDSLIPPTLGKIDSHVYRSQFLKLMGWDAESGKDAKGERDFFMSINESEKELDSQQKSLQEQTIDAKNVKPTEITPKQSNLKQPKTTKDREHKQRPQQKKDVTKRTRFEDDSDASANRSPYRTPIDDSHKPFYSMHKSDTGSADFYPKDVKHAYHKHSKRHTEGQSESQLHLRAGSPPPSSPDVQKDSSILRHDSSISNDRVTLNNAVDKDVVLWSPWEGDLPPRKALQRPYKKKKKSPQRCKQRSEMSSSDDSDYADAESQAFISKGDRDYVMHSAWTNTLDKWIQEREDIRKRRKLVEQMQGQAYDKQDYQCDNIIPEGNDYVSPSIISDDGICQPNHTTKFSNHYYPKDKRKNTSERHTGKRNNRIRYESTDSVESTDVSENNRSFKILVDETENARPEMKTRFDPSVQQKSKRSPVKPGYKQPSKKTASHSSASSHGSFTRFSNYSRSRSSKHSSPGQKTPSPRGPTRQKSQSKSPSKQNGPSPRSSSQRLNNVRSRHIGFKSKTNLPSDRRNFTQNKPLKKLVSQIYDRRSLVHSSKVSLLGRKQNHSQRSLSKKKSRTHSGSSTPDSRRSSPISRSRSNLATSKTSRSAMTPRSRSNLPSPKTPPRSNAGSPSRSRTNIKKSNSMMSVLGPKSASDINISSPKSKFDTSMPLETINVRGPLKDDKNRRPLVEINIFGPLDACCDEKDGGKLNVKQSLGKVKSKSNAKKPESPKKSTSKLNQLSGSDDCMQACLQECNIKCDRQHSSNYGKFGESDSCMTFCDECYDESCNHPRPDPEEKNTPNNKLEVRLDYRPETPTLEECGGFMFSEYKKGNQKKSNLRRNAQSMFSTCPMNIEAEKSNTSKNTIEKSQVKKSSDSPRKQLHLSPSKQKLRGKSVQIPHSHNQQNSTKKEIDTTRNKAGGDNENASSSYNELCKLSNSSDCSNITPVLRLKEFSEKQYGDSNKTPSEIVKIRTSSTANRSRPQTKARKDNPVPVTKQRSRSASIPRSNVKPQTKAKSSCYPFFYKDPQGKSNLSKSLSSACKKTQLKEDKTKKSDLFQNKVIPTFRIKKYPETIWHRYVKAERENQNWSNKIAEVAEANIPLTSHSPVRYHQGSIEGSFFSPVVSVKPFSSTQELKKERESMSPMKLFRDKRTESKTTQSRTSCQSVRGSPNKYNRLLSREKEYEKKASINGQVLSGWSQQKPPAVCNSSNNRLPSRSGMCETGGGDDTNTEKIWSHSPTRPITGRRVHHDNAGVKVSSRATACMVDEPVNEISPHPQYTVNDSITPSINLDRGDYTIEKIYGRSRPGPMNYRYDRRTSNEEEESDAMNFNLKIVDSQPPCPISELNSARRERYRQRRRKISPICNARPRKRSGPSPPSSSSSSSSDNISRCRQRPSSASYINKNETTKKIRPISALDARDVKANTTKDFGRQNSLQTFSTQSTASSPSKGTKQMLLSNSSIRDSITKDEKCHGEHRSILDWDDFEGEPTFRAARRILDDNKPPSTEPEWHDRHVSLMGECSEEKMENAAKRTHRIVDKTKNLAGSVSQLKLNFGDIETRLDKVHTIQRNYLCKAERAVEMVRAGESGHCSSRPRDRSRNNVSRHQRQKSNSHKYHRNKTNNTKITVHFCQEPCCKPHYDTMKNKVVAANANLSDDASGAVECTNSDSKERAQLDKELLTRVRQSFRSKHISSGSNHQRAPCSERSIQESECGSCNFSKIRRTCAENCSRYETRRRNERNCRLKCNRTDDFNGNCCKNVCSCADKEHISGNESLDECDRSSNNSNLDCPCWSRILSQYRNSIKHSTTDANKGCDCKRASQSSNHNDGETTQTNKKISAVGGRGKCESLKIERVRKWAATQTKSPKNDKISWDDSARRESGYESDLPTMCKVSQEPTNYLETLRKVVKDFVESKSKHAVNSKGNRFAISPKALLRVYGQIQRMPKKRHTIKKNCIGSQQKIRPTSSPGNLLKSKIMFTDTANAQKIYKKSLPCKTVHVDKSPSRVSSKSRSTSRNRKQWKKTCFRKTISHGKYSLHRKHQRPHSRNSKDTPRISSPITQVSRSTEQNFEKQKEYESSNQDDLYDSFYSSDTDTGNQTTTKCADHDDSHLKLDRAEQSNVNEDLSSSTADEMHICLPDESTSSTFLQCNHTNRASSLSSHPCPINTTPGPIESSDERYSCTSPPPPPPSPFNANKCLPSSCFQDEHNSSCCASDVATKNNTLNSDSISNFHSDVNDDGELSTSVNLEDNDNSTSTHSVNASQYFQNDASLIESPASNYESSVSTNAADVCNTNIDDKEIECAEEYNNQSYKQESFKSYNGNSHSLTNSDHDSELWGIDYSGNQYLKDYVNRKKSHHSKNSKNSKTGIHSSERLTNSSDRKEKKDNHVQSFHRHESPSRIRGMPVREYALTAIDIDSKHSLKSNGKHFILRRNQSPSTHRESTTRRDETYYHIPPVKSNCSNTRNKDTALFGREHHDPTDCFKPVRVTTDGKLRVGKTTESNSNKEEQTYIRNSSRKPRHHVCEENTTPEVSSNLLQDVYKNRSPKTPHRVRFAESDSKTSKAVNPSHESTDRSKSVQFQYRDDQRRASTQPSTVHDCWTHSKRVLRKLTEADNAVKTPNKTCPKTNYKSRPLSADANELRKRYSQSNFCPLYGISPLPSPAIPVRPASSYSRRKPVTIQTDSQQSNHVREHVV